MPFYEKLEKYKIAPQAKSVKFKVKHFVKIPTIRHDKAVPPPPPAWLPKIIFPPWMCPYSGSWSLAFAPLPGWWHKNHSAPWSQGGRGHYACAVVSLDVVIDFIWHYSIEDRHKYREWDWKKSNVKLYLESS